MIGETENGDKGEFKECPGNLATINSTASVDLLCN